MHGPGAAVVGDGLVPSRSEFTHEPTRGRPQGSPLRVPCQITRQTQRERPQRIRSMEHQSACGRFGVTSFPGTASRQPRRNGRCRAKVTTEKVDAPRKGIRSSSPAPSARSPPRTRPYRSCPTRSAPAWASPTTNTGRRASRGSISSGWQRRRRRPSTPSTTGSSATIRHRSQRAKGCVGRQSMLSMIYKMGMSAEQSWRRLRGFQQLAKVIEGVKFNDGIEVIEDSRAAA